MLLSTANPFLPQRQNAWDGRVVQVRVGTVFSWRPILQKLQGIFMWTTCHFKVRDVHTDLTFTSLTWLPCPLSALSFPALLQSLQVRQGLPHQSWLCSSPTFRLLGDPTASFSEVPLTSIFPFWPGPPIWARSLARSQQPGFTPMIYMLWPDHLYSY